LGKVRRWCPDCGHRLEADEMLKHRKVPRQFVKNIYICNNCSEKQGVSVVMGIIRMAVPENKFWKTIEVMMFTERK